MHLAEQRWMPCVVLDLYCIPGVLDFDAADAAQALMAIADTDKDGKLSLKEFENAFAS